MREELTATRQEQAAMRVELTATREEVAALRVDYEGFRRETNDNFELVHHKLDVMNNDILTVRAQQKDLEQRVTRIEQEPTRSAA